MKESIELHHEQALKLMGMVRKLFPDALAVRVMAPNDMIKFEIGTKAFKFHWFEFVTTILCERMFIYIEGNGEVSQFIETLFYNYYENKIHPIEYLFQEFKEIKK